MKKLTILFLFTATFITNAQENEIKVDVFDVLALKTFDIAYEYTMNDESSVGISVLFNFEKESANFRYSEEFAITPYYRQHLFDRGNINFYGELFAAINTGDIELTAAQRFANEDDTYTDVAFGLSFGGKYISDSGFVLDFHAGLGRNLFSDISPTLVPRVGIAVGKSF